MLIIPFHLGFQPRYILAPVGNGQDSGLSWKAFSGSLIFIPGPYDEVGEEATASWIMERGCPECMRGYEPRGGGGRGESPGHWSLSHVCPGGHSDKLTRVCFVVACRVGADHARGTIYVSFLCVHRHTSSTVGQSQCILSPISFPAHRAPQLLAVFPPEHFSGLNSIVESSTSTVLKPQTRLSPRLSVRPSVARHVRSARARPLFQRTYPRSHNHNRKHGNVSGAFCGPRPRTGSGESRDSPVFREGGVSRRGGPRWGRAWKWKCFLWKWKCFRARCCCWWRGRGRRVIAFHSLCLAGRGSSGVAMIGFISGVGIFSGYGGSGIVVVLLCGNDSSCSLFLKTRDTSSDEK